MENKVLWIVLSEKCRTCAKMKELKEKFDKKKKDVDLTTPYAVSVMDDLEKAYKKGYKCITYLDDVYPEELRNISYPPPYLYIRGNMDVLNFPVKVAVVGSREATSYGLNVANEFSHELSANNVCIVSGGAKGIDTAALRGAMRASTPVIAVIGTGIDVDYPKENAELFKKIEEKGLIISEFPMGMGPLGRNFPLRNRIMTAISDAVLVVEAAEKSGALISATHANEQGKQVFSVPGNINSPNSAGTNALIRDGAFMATSSTDILYDIMERMPDKYRQAKGYVTKEDEAMIKAVKSEVIIHKAENEKNDFTEHTNCEKAVINAIKAGKNTYEDILEFSSMETNKLTSLLTIMEIKGIIKRGFRNKYILND